MAGHVGVPGRPREPRPKLPGHKEANHGQTHVEPGRKVGGEQEEDDGGQEAGGGGGANQGGRLVATRE